MKISITTRDFKFFFLGIIAAFIFATIYNWKDNIKAFKEGAAQAEIDYDKSKDK